MPKPPIIMTDSTLTVILSGNQHVLDSSHPNWELVRQAIRDQRWDDLEDLVDIPKAVTSWSQGRYKVTDGALLYSPTFFRVPGDEEEVHSSISRRVTSMMSEGIDFEHLLNFHHRLQSNPSKRAVDELYDFLEHKNIPIGPDGCFYAYKSVTEDFKDWHTRSFDNSPGAVNEMPRNKVDDNRARHCSAGFHAGALEYASSFGGWNGNKKVVIVKIDPSDVVSVPADSQCMKVRTAKYEVVDEYTGPLPDGFYDHTAVPEDDLFDDEDLGFEDEYDDEYGVW